MTRIKPYEELAKIYDRVMDHVDYDSWAQYILTAFRRYGHQIFSVLEIACGTGNLSIHLARQGLDLVCMDLCPEMVQIASRKYYHNGNTPLFVAANMTAMPFQSKFDSVICMYDSINYLCEPSDFRKAVTEISMVLKSGGLFIFDVCTVSNSEKFFADSTMNERFDDISYERRCKYYRSARLQENHFVISSKHGCIAEERHLQKIYYLREVEEMLAGLPFEKIGIFDDMTFAPGGEDSDRVHFILKKI